LYNDPRVKDIATQTLDDFQPLCGQCNTLKGKIQKKEFESKKLWSAKGLPRYAFYDIGEDIPFEKKDYDPDDIDCKKGTYWYDILAFDKKMFEHYSKNT